MSKLERDYLQLAQAGRTDEADALLDARLQQNSADHEALLLKVAALSNSAEWDRIDEHLSAALRESPDDGKLHKLQGDALRARGDMQGAEQAYQLAWELDPLQSEAAHGLAGVRKHTGDEPFLSELEQQLLTPGLPSSVQSKLHFAAGKVSDDQSDYERAFEHYLEANRLAGINTSVEPLRVMVERSQAVFSKKFFRTFKKAGTDSRLPLFVVGMPRSGTTLLEQMLSRHGSVEGLGELPYMAAISQSLASTYRSPLAYPDVLKNLQVDHAALLGDRYVSSLRGRMTQSVSLRGVDKSPMNFLLLGLIQLLLPRAQVLHTVRHPLDTCLSCFFQPFGEGGMGFTYSLDSCAEVYQLYREMMRFWQRMLPGQSVEVRYDDLVSDPDATLRRVLGFCSLPWDAKCLDQEAGNKVIRTASYWQARQPVYTSSRERWRNYEPFLGPVMSKLEKYL